MVEQKALAYANMYGVLGALEKLCEIDEEVVNVSKKYLSRSTAVAFDDPRVELVR